MNSLLFFPIYIFPIIGVATYGYLSAANKEEEMLILKMIGYFLLGSFIYWYGFIPIPIGLLIAFLLKPKNNGKTKRNIVYIGTAVAVISHLFVF
ncbi:hypothetical protein QA612_07410 [Evansella sp. AB-P1]|uniref:hypothetical protein n=1 Tax=Evansella sp. AB-P1 TaxID=3037653 RepID=UPI00241F849E|nr:hypothetical protein [Evansella sp. AB-P1]MDG5787318.1 hypothetical protein [Evansella sp. AB-P1]